MATMQISIPDEVLSAFSSRYPNRPLDAVMEELMRERIAPSPYSPEAFAEDEAAYQRHLTGKDGHSTEDVFAAMEQQLSAAGLTWPS